MKTVVYLRDEDLTYVDDYPRKDWDWVGVSKDQYEDMIKGGGIDPEKWGLPTEQILGGLAPTVVKRRRPHFYGAPRPHRIEIGDPKAYMRRIKTLGSVKMLTINPTISSKIDPFVAMAYAAAVVSAVRLEGRDLQVCWRTEQGRKISEILYVLPSKTYTLRKALFVLSPYFLRGGPIIKISNKSLGLGPKGTGGTPRFSDAEIGSWQSWKRHVRDPTMGFRPCVEDIRKEIERLDREHK